MTSNDARHHAAHAATRDRTADAAAMDAQNDRTAATTAATAAEAQTHADHAAAAAQTAMDAAINAEHHATMAERAMQAAADRALLAIADDYAPAQEEANDAEDAWIAARNAAAHARLCAELAHHHAVKAQTTARSRWQQEAIRREQDARETAARLLREANAATDAAIATGRTERDAHAALLAASTDFRLVAMAATSEKTAAMQDALLRLQVAAISYGDAIDAHAAALLAEQDAWDAARRVDADVTRTNHPADRR